jgi:hypothetical protein
MLQLLIFTIIKYRNDAIKEIWLRYLNSGLLASSWQMKNELSKTRKKNLASRIAPFGGVIFSLLFLFPDRVVAPFVRHSSIEERYVCKDYQFLRYTFYAYDYAPSFFFPLNQ